jgi:long-chain acyl-CoA synthetase
MNWREAEASFDSPVFDPSTLPASFEATAARQPDRVAQRYKGGVAERSLVAGGVVDAAPDGAYADLTYAEMRGVVRRLAAGLRDAGVAPGDRVAVHAPTRAEWAQVDYAALAAGAVVTTVYASASPSGVAYLLSDPGATVAVVGGADELGTVLSVVGETDVSLVVAMDDVGAGDVDADAPADVEVCTLAALHGRGAAAYDADAYESWVAEREPGDLASVVYTSGTTGRPKGVRLTHGNFKSNADAAYRRFGPRPDKGDLPVVGPDATFLSFLPLAHVFERLAGHFLPFAAGATVAYAESPDSLREDLALVRPTMATSVPRVYERLYDAMRRRAGSGLRRRIFEWAVDVARRRHDADDPGPLLALRARLADRLVFSEVREALGGNLELFISGGGSLSAELCALYHGMGVPVYEGYGLTETSPVVSANPPEAPRVGTIGPPLPGVEVRVDGSAVGERRREAAAGEVGELLVRGPNVFEGYWERPGETAAALEDGWFRTGDVVERRPDGYLVFRERLKQLLVLSTGKNVAPGPIEDAFATSDVVEQAMVLGDGRKFVSALLVPNVEGLREWAAEAGVDLPDGATALRRDDRVRERLEREVDRVNADLEPHETIKRFRVIAEPFSEADGTMTPTMKKRRRAILDRHVDDVAALYE